MKRGLVNTGPITRESTPQWGWHCRDPLAEEGPWGLGTDSLKYTLRWLREDGGGYRGRESRHDYQRMDMVFRLGLPVL